MADAADRRCPRCDALVAPDAEWCGQCFTSLVEPAEPDPVPVPVPGGDEVRGAPTPAPTPRPERVAAAPAEPFWPCPVCQAQNPIEADSCQTCGTPFAQAMRSQEERPRAGAREAVTRSLIFPGLGHAAVGRTTDGFVRGVLFGLSLSIAVLAGLGGVASAALLGIVVVNLLTAVGVYVLSAVEASRLAEGGELLVPSRSLLWVLVGDILLSIAIVGFAVVTATRG